jgi:homoserine dehydrogenase
MKKYKIGLFGFGCVGQGFFETLNSNTEISAEVVKIAVRQKNQVRKADAKLFVYDIDSVLNDDDIDLFVELIDDPDLALSIVKTALSKGKPVVTANKKMLAENLEELIELQNKYKTPIRYEGAVCGSIPILKNIDTYYNSEKIESIKGIFNGSTNYILSKIFNENISYESALKSAQENGFAESDPTLDVEGHDPKYKLSILASHIFGQVIHPSQIINWGINKLQKHDFDFAKENDLKIKLVAKVEEADNELSLLVAPHFVSKYNPLYHIEDENNIVTIEGAYSGQQILSGKGAGSLPTGLAVLSDVREILKGQGYNYKKSLVLKPIKNDLVEAYVSFSLKHSFVTELFQSITERYVGKDYSYVIGQIKISQLQTIIKLKSVNAIITSGNKIENITSKISYSYA